MGVKCLWRTRIHFLCLLKLMWYSLPELCCGPNPEIRIWISICTYSRPTLYCSSSFAVLLRIFSVQFCIFFFYYYYYILFTFLFFNSTLCWLAVVFVNQSSPIQNALILPHLCKQILIAIKSLFSFCVKMFMTV